MAATFIDVDAKSSVELLELLRWTYQNLGNNGWDWDFVGPSSNQYLVRFDFDKEKDATIFVLRWA